MFLNNYRAWLDHAHIRWIYLYFSLASLFRGRLQVSSCSEREWCAIHFRSRHQLYCFRSGYLSRTPACLPMSALCQRFLPPLFPRGSGSYRPHPVTIKMRRFLSDYELFVYLFWMHMGLSRATTVLSRTKYLCTVCFLLCIYLYVRLLAVFPMCFQSPSSPIPWFYKKAKFFFLSLDVILSRQQWIH